MTLKINHLKSSNIESLITQNSLDQLGNFVGTSLDDLVPRLISDLMGSLYREVFADVPDLVREPAEPSFGEVYVINSKEDPLTLNKTALSIPSQLKSQGTSKEAVEEIGLGRFSSLELYQQEAVLSKASQIKAAADGACSDQDELWALQALDSLKLLLSPPDDLKVFITMLKICPNLLPYVPIFISILHIQDQAVLIEIAKLCAQESGAGTAEHIENFGIQDESALIEIAKLCAQQSGAGTAEHIENFGIQNESALIEIAKLCAQQSGWGTAEYIQNFGIEDELVLIEIAKLCARESGWGTARHIQNFVIQNQNVLIEIAILCAQESGWGTAQNIQNFGIENQAILIEIAILCAEESGSGTAKYIQNFGIQDEVVRIELAKLCAEQDGVGTAEYIQNFDIQNRGFYDWIGIYCLITSAGEAYEHLRINIPEIATLLTDLGPLFEASKNQTLSKDLLVSSLHYFMTHHLAKQSPFLSYLALLDNIKDPYAQRQAGVWLATILVFIHFFSPQQQAEIFKTGLVEALCVMGSPALRLKLTPVLMELVINSNSFTLFQQRLNTTDDGKARILNLLLCSLEASGIARKTTDAIRERLVPAFRGGSTEIRPLLEMLYYMHISPLLLQSEKQWFLDELLVDGIQRKQGERKNVYKNRIGRVRSKAKNSVIALLTLLLFRDEKQLVDQVFQLKFRDEKYRLEFTNDFYLKFLPLEEDLMAKKEGVIVHGVKGMLQHHLFLASSRDQIEKLYERLMPDRNPTALMVYAAKLSSLHDSHVMKDLGRYVNGVITGAYPKDRYRLEHNPHLQQIAENDPLILQKWQVALELQHTKFQQELQPCESIAQVEEQLEKPHSQPPGLSQEVELVDTDHYFDLLMSGTEVAGSCQRVDETPSLNKGLLGYLLDGKNRMLAVKDKRGKLMARAKFSLLWDGAKPVLFLERLYTQGSYEKQCRQAIESLALRKAQKLGLDVAILKESEYAEGNPLGRDLHALGSGVSYEYSDAMAGVQKDGEYTIPKEKLVFLKAPQ